MGCCDEPIKTKSAVILMGLPLSGKSTWIKDNKDRYPDHMLISADNLKLTHPEYTPEEAYRVHQWSVDEAEKQVYHCTKHSINFIMDGGGINNSYTVRIIDHLAEKGYHVELVHIKTPVQVCLRRNQFRERKVPEEAIIAKAVKEVSQFERIALIVDKVTVVDYFTHEHIFIDMDGVIASWMPTLRVNGKIDFVNGEFFRYLKPVKAVLDKLNSISHNRYFYILSGTVNSFAYDEKMEWLDRHFNIPPTHRFFVNQGRHKAEMLNNLKDYLKLDERQVTLLDDTAPILDQVNDMCMRGMHVSEFLTYDFKQL